MLTYKNILIILFLFFILNSCFYKNFTLYRYKPFIKERKEIKTDGVYFMENSFSLNNNLPFWFSFTLYNDGIIYVNYNTNRKDEPWGHFIIRKDTIYIQFFYNLPSDQTFNTWRLINTYGIIKNDTSILIYKEKCNWCKNYLSEWKYKNEKIYSPAVEYYFFKTKSKPDSSKAWFFNKRWYKK